jgi:hypothetical protein
MNKRRVFPFIFVVAALLLASCSETTLLFQVQDAVSGAWVWDATTRIQDRILTSYYQTDAGPILQKMSHLSPGAATLAVSAPGYQSISVPVVLRRGKNRLSAPIALAGRAIPGLDSFSVFESVDNGDFSMQIRPLDAAGKAILHHPCIDVWVGCVVSEQALDGVPVRAEEAVGATRGAALYRGTLPWSWDAKPESLFRYTAHLSSADVIAAPSLYRVIDYLIVVPDPASITHEELSSRMATAWASGGLVAGNPTRSRAPVMDANLAAALEPLKGRVWFYLITSWDVRARQS